MKIIFLDIDGVLNSAQSANFWHNKRDQKKWENETYASWKGTLSEYLAQEFCPIALSNLEELMREVPDAKIVVSSTWRIGETVESLKNIFNCSPLVASAIIDVTPYIYKDSKHVERGHEIQHWLTEHPEVTRFIIIDDDSDMVHLIPNLIKTDSYHGFQFKDMLKAKNFLNEVE